MLPNLNPVWIEKILFVKTYSSTGVKCGKINLKMSGLNNYIKNKVHDTSTYGIHDTSMWFSCLDIYTKWATCKFDWFFHILYKLIYFDPSCNIKRRFLLKITFYFYGLYNKMLKKKNNNNFDPMFFVPCCENVIA